MNKTLACNTGLLTLIIIICVAAIIALIAFIIHKYMNLKLKDDGKPTQEEVAREELDRLLKPVDDEETARQISEYRDKDE